jgi:CCR4-NOT transcription complex subunit 1
MIAQYGMEVFPKFFRRAVQLNADYIFSNSSQTPQGSYDLLSKYVQTIRRDPQEADNVADSIDTTEGDLFKNFDVSKFMDHFKLDPVAKSMLALSLKNASRPDLRTKGNKPHFHLIKGYFSHTIPFYTSTTQFRSAFITQLNLQV